MLGSLSFFTLNNQVLGEVCLPASEVCCALEDTAVSSICVLMLRSQRQELTGRGKTYKRKNTDNES